MHVRDPNGRTWNLSDTNDRAMFFQTYGLDPSVWPEMYDMLHGNNGKGLGVYSREFLEWEQQYKSLQEAEKSGDYTGFLGDMAKNGTELNPEMEKYIDDRISQQNTQQQQSYETQMRDTSLMSSAAQLQELGLSPSSVVNVGGASSGVNSTPADTAMRSNSGLRAQMKMNQYNQRMSLAKSLIGAAGQMASSGIYGAAIGAVKHSAQVASAAAANSGLKALQAMRPAVRDQLMKDESWRYNNSHNELLK